MDQHNLSCEDRNMNLPSKSIGALCFMGLGLLLCSSLRGEDALELVSADPAPSSSGSTASVAVGGFDACCSCDECHPWEAYLFAGLDSFRGISNGSYPSNEGLSGGFNAGFALPGLKDYGIGGQFGASYGESDFGGKVSPGSRLNDAESQTFITIGLFRRATENAPVSAGLAYDYMIGSNFGTFGSDLSLSQWRGEIAYALNGCNEFGLWGARHDRGYSNSFGALGTPIEYRATNQIDLFWNHTFCQTGAEGGIYVGLPTETRLAQAPSGFPVGGFGGKLGFVILGTNWNVPLTDRLSLFANGTYMAPSQGAGGVPTGAFAATQEFWSISFGLNFYLDRNALRCAGRPSFMPLMPLANNGTFITDCNKTE
jgi:hypothetical protein